MCRRTDITGKHLLLWHWFRLHKSLSAVRSHCPPSRRANVHQTLLYNSTGLPVLTPCVNDRWPPFTWLISQIIIYYKLCKQAFWCDSELMGFMLFKSDAPVIRWLTLWYQRFRHCLWVNFLVADTTISELRDQGFQPWNLTAFATSFVLKIAYKSFIWP